MWNDHLVDSHLFLLSILRNPTASAKFTSTRESKSNLSESRLPESIHRYSTKHHLSNLHWRVTFFISPDLRIRCMYKCLHFTLQILTIKLQSQELKRIHQILYLIVLFKNQMHQAVCRSASHSFDFQIKSKLSSLKCDVWINLNFQILELSITGLKLNLIKIATFRSSCFY